MRVKLLLSGMLVLGGVVSVNAQSNEPTINRTLYPDYSNTYNPDPSLLVHPTAKTVAKNGRAVLSGSSTTLPEYVNNAETKFFPGIFSQIGNSCGPSSRIGYMFAYELNALRDADGSLLKNHYPTHFVFPYSYDGVSKDQFARYVGIPNGETYGGEDWSSIYGLYDENSNDAGWMTGYSKWYEAMHNRISHTTNIPADVTTEAGMLALKWWLYNHNGDPNFRGVGGVAGIGVGIATSATATVGSSTANDANGFTGKTYLKHWNLGSIDHAMTIVGYDDRIEFDLDSNGTYGEASNLLGQNEKGAWLVANSWGTGYANGGIVYVPYPLAAPTSQETTVTVNGETKTVYKRPGGGWTPELYIARVNYTPLRTLKVKMTYSKRSEVSLSVGIATDTTATQPEATIAVRNINYNGDRDGDGVDAEVPLLGRWADGKLHTEAMELGYDLTDLSAAFDTRKPLKYFFIVSTKSTANGEGNIYNASIIDYEFNAKGIETPFAISGASVPVQTGGKQTILTTIVNGEALNAPRNLTLENTTLKWEAPTGTAYVPTKYNIYDGTSLVGSSTTTSFTLTGGTTGSYTVKAVYSIDGSEHLSGASNSVAAAGAYDTSVDANAYYLYNNGFTISDVFTDTYANATIEYWLKPAQLTNWNQQVGKGWGNFLIHANADRTLSFGWDNSNRVTTSATLNANAWNHIAIVIEGNKMTGYINGNNVGSFTSSSYSGIGGFGDFLFGLSNGSAMTGYIDEVRLWKEARTATEITKYKDYPLMRASQWKNLMAYYKMDTVQTNGTTYLIDCVGGHNAPLHSYGKATYYANQIAQFNLSQSLTAGISAPTATNTNTPVELEDASSSKAVAWQWDVDGTAYTIKNPTVSFSSAGTKNVSLTVTDASGGTATTSTSIAVTAPELTADFTLTADSTAGSDRISFLSKNTLAGCKYEWSMPGADVETATTVNASASYSSTGTYTVTLKVTAPDGTVRTSQQTFKVVATAPEIDYTIAPSIILKGEQVTLTDKSLYTPTTYLWRLVSGNRIISATGATATITPEEPGVYSLYYRVGNEKGTTATTQERALIVCNAQSQNGLNFTTAAQRLETSLPSNGITNAWTIDFWMKPNELGGQGIAGKGWNLTANAKGAVTITDGSSTVKSAEGLLVNNEWHHYAFTFSNGTFTYYRDGVSQGSSALSTTNFSGMLDSLILGGSNAPMQAMLDEFRLWNKVLTLNEIKQYCVEPIAPTTTGLVLYYQFNQSGGNVTDATANGYTGVRVNSGPDGDVWSSSEGVFAISFAEPDLAAVTQGDKIASSKFTVVAFSDEEATGESGGAQGKAKYVIDENSSTYWHSQWSGTTMGYPHSVTFKHAPSDTIRSLQVNYIPSRSETYRAAAVSIEVSDDSINWTTIEEEFPLFNIATTGLVFSQPVTQKYIRVIFTRGVVSTSNYLCIAELGFYGSLLQLEALDKSGMQVIAWSDEQASLGYVATNILDDNNTNFWSSLYTPSSARVSFPHSVTIERSELDAISEIVCYQGSNGFRASAFNVEQADDTTAWETLETGVALSTAASPTTAVLSTPITKKYFRLTFTKGQNANILRINELYFNGIKAGALTGIDTVPTATESATSSSSGDYDLQGRRITRPQNGQLIIRNGKKVYVVVK